MAGPQVDDLEAAGVGAVGQHHEAVAGPDLVLRVLLGLRDLGLNLLVVRSLEVRAQHTVADIPLHPTPGEKQLDLVPQVPTRLPNAPDERAGVQPRRLAPVLRPLGDLAADGLAAIPFAGRVEDHQIQTRRVRHGAAVGRERFDGDARPALDLLLYQRADRGLDLVLVVEGSPAVVNRLVDLRLVEDLESVRANRLDEEPFGLQGDRCCIY